MIPREDSNEDHWSSVRFSEPIYRVIGNMHTSTQVMGFRSCRKGFEDNFNTLDFDPDRQIAVAGTEKGHIFYIHLKRNKILMCFQADSWLNSTIFCGDSVLSTGSSKTILQFKLTSPTAILRLKLDSSFEGYSHKGIILQRRDKRSNLIANAGYLTFLFLHGKTQKVTRRIAIPADQVRGPLDAQVRKVVHTYIALRHSSLLCFMLCEDPHLYVFDYLAMKIIYRLPLFDSRTLTQRSFLSNIVMTSYDDYFVVILQFNINNKGVMKKNSIIYFFRVLKDQPSTGGHKVDYLFFSGKEGIESVISSDLHKLMSDKPELNKFASQGNYYFLVMGTAAGLYRVAIVNFDTKTAEDLFSIRMCESSTHYLLSRRNLCSQAQRRRDIVHHFRGKHYLYQATPVSETKQIGCSARVSRCFISLSRPAN